MVSFFCSVSLEDCLARNPPWESPWGGKNSWREGMQTFSGKKFVVEKNCGAVFREWGGSELLV